MNTNKIREALELAARLTELNPNNYGSDDVWDSIQQIRELAPIVDEALAELDSAPKVLTVEEAMQAVDDWLHAMFPDSKHTRHPLGSPYRTDQAAQDNLRARLTAKLNTKNQ